MINIHLWYFDVQDIASAETLFEENKSANKLILIISTIFDAIVSIPIVQLIVECITASNDTTPNSNFNTSLQIGIIFVLPLLFYIDYLICCRHIYKKNVWKPLSYLTLFVIWTVFESIYIDSHQLRSNYNIYHWIQFPQQVQGSSLKWLLTSGLFYSSVCLSHFLLSVVKKQILDKYLLTMKIQSQTGIKTLTSQATNTKLTSKNLLSKQQIQELKN